MNTNRFNQLLESKLGNVKPLISEQTTPINSKTDSSKVGNQKYSKGRYQFNYLDDEFNNTTPIHRGELEITDVSTSGPPNGWVLVKVSSVYELYPVEGRPGVFSHPNLKDEDGKPQYIKIYQKGE